MTIYALRSLAEIVAERLGERTKLMICEKCENLILMIYKAHKVEKAEKDISTIRSDLIEEIADVFLALGVAMNRFGIFSDEIERAIANKLKQEDMLMS